MQKPERLYAIDLARGFAILYMILVHTQIVYGTTQAIHSPLGRLIDFLGGPPAAPVFMMLMGTSAYFSRHTDRLSGLKRGFNIFLLGYLLNFLRGVLPVWTMQAFCPSAAAALPPDIANVKEAFLEIDILQFAGLALMAMAFLREFRPSRGLLLLLAALSAALAPVLWNWGTEIPVAGRALDLLWGSRPSAAPAIENWVSFPFFPWISFVLTGMFIGDILSQSEDKARDIRRLGFGGLLLLILSYATISNDLPYHMGDYYHSKTGAVVMCTGIALLCLYLAQIMLEKLPANAFFKLLISWSRDVNRIYLIQWIAIMWGACFLGYNRFSATTVITLGLGMCAFTHLANMACLRLKNRSVQPPAQGQ